jgi:hypothetical protein
MVGGFLTGLFWARTLVQGRRIREQRRRRVVLIGLC